MKKALIWAIVLLIALMPACYAEMPSLLDHATQGKSMQAWADELQAGEDNYILALRSLDAEMDLSACGRSILDVLEAGGESNPVTRQKYALSVIACGGIELLPENIADETIGELGVMSYIFGLHLLNNGVSSEKWSREAVIEAIAGLRKADGGWAVTGNFGDVDTTAMCMQALACYDGEMDVQPLLDAGVSLISARQKDNGGFASFGVENAESAAQAILALKAVGIDPLSDARFIKNNNTILDAMLSYKLENGGFSHTAGAPESEMANMQVLQALICLENGKNIYDLSAVQLAGFRAARSWKFYAWIGIAAFAVLGSALSMIKKRGRGKRVLFILIAAAIAACAVFMLNFETAGDYYTASDVQNPDGQVWISIRCDTVAGLSDDGSTPADGAILPRTQMPYVEGDTVFDVLTRAVREHKLHMEYEGVSTAQAYVKGINYLYELAYGDLSGWIYSVNGGTASQSCGTHAVHDGVEIIFAYTTELGEDLK